MFGGLVYFLGSSPLPRYHVQRLFVFIHIHFLYENKVLYMDLYIEYTLVLEGSENGIPCEPQIRCVRASDTTYVAEEVEVLLRENK